MNNNQWLTNPHWTFIVFVRKKATTKGCINFEVTEIHEVMLPPLPLLSNFVMSKQHRCTVNLL